MNVLSGVKNFFKAMGGPSQKDFQAQGKLAPKQFVQAGDQLANFGFRWQSGLKQSKSLPDKKQYLVSQALSMKRIKQLIDPTQEINKEGFLEIIAEEQDERMEDARRYDIYISYDEYYFTPRMWLKGTDYEGRPLTTKMIFEDIDMSYQNQTVTQQIAPFLNCRMITIHPCKQSQVLKIFIDEAKKNGKIIKPFQALIIFLKFMSSVIPTIRYQQGIDFTLQ